MPCHNCGMEDGELDAFEGNSICGGCGVVLEHSPLAANIEFTKVGSRFHVVGAFVSNTEERLPIQVLNNNKVGQGSQEMYKWNRMVRILTSIF
jgi:transcription initiation factor TFIIIB Brf1 subunit/transcription initiation factor TFIIB